MAIRRGEIYFVDLNPVRGREQAGRRPVLVISNDKINQRPLVITVVIGTSGANVPDDYDTNVRVPASASGLPHETVFMCFQIRSIDRGRIVGKRAGRLGAPWMSRVQDTIQFCLDLA